MSYSLSTTSCGAGSDDDDDDVQCEEVDPMEILFGDAGDTDSDADSSPGKPRGGIDNRGQRSALSDRL